jgi:hypothetical protein
MDIVEQFAASIVFGVVFGLVFGVIITIFRRKG